MSGEARVASPVGQGDAVTASVAGQARQAPQHRLDLPMLIAVFALCAIGLVMVYSSSAVAAGLNFKDTGFYLKRQLIAAAIGFAGMLFVLKVGYRRLAFFAWPILIFAVLGLIAVLIPGIGTVAGGARRWIRLAGFSYQPAEFAKLALVLYLAFSLAKKREKVRIFSIGFLPHCLITGFLALLLLREPDFGSTLVIGFVLCAMLFAAGTKMSYLVAAFFLAVPFAWHQVASSPYRMRRITAFLDPWATRNDVGYQVAESLMSIGSGGFGGLGLGDGRHKLFFLPEAHTDFIMAIIGEEFGFIGLFILLALFGVLLWRGVLASLNATEPFGAWLALGLTCLLGIEVVVNAGVTMGVLPTKGLALPFVSYGGTALIVNLIAAGLLLSVAQGRGGFLRPQKGGAR